MTFEEWLTPGKAAVAASLAALAVILPILKNALDVWSRLPKRPKVTVSRDLNSLPEVGNTITIVNHSDKPMLIGHWSLVWVHGMPPWLKWGEVIAAEEEPGGGELSVPAHDRQRLSFIDQDWFDWGWKLHVRGRLFLKLWREGATRPDWYHVHTPGK